MDGWIKLHRKLNESAFKNKPLIVALFVDLLTNANHAQRKIIFNKKEMIIKAGQLVTGRKALTKRTGISDQSIRTGLATLKSTNTITIVSNNQFSVITICNWSRYQLLTSKLTNNQPATNQRLTTNNNVKNDKNITNSNGNYGNPEINLILSSYKKCMGFSPTDRKPNFVAQNMRSRIKSFIKEIEPYKKFTYDEVVEKVFKWYGERDELKGETLNAVKLKMGILFDRTKTKYKVVKT